MYSDSCTLSASYKIFMSVCVHQRLIVILSRVTESVLYFTGQVKMVAIVGSPKVSERSRLVHKFLAKVNDNHDSICFIYYIHYNNLHSIGEECTQYTRQL